MCTNRINRAFTRFFLHNEKAVYSQPIQNGGYPFVTLWNCGIADERPKLVDDPYSSRPKS